MNYSEKKIGYKTQTLHFSLKEVKYFNSKSCIVKWRLIKDFLKSLKGKIQTRKRVWDNDLRELSKAIIFKDVATMKKPLAKQISVITVEKDGSLAISRIIS